MIIRLYSDLHLEFGDYTINAQEHDKDATLILAGDICEKIKGEIFVEKCCKQFKNVIYVLGNHEFYKGEFFKVHRMWKEIEERNDNLYVLNDETVVLDGVRFLGSTLWSDCNNRDWFAMQAAKGMQDFHVIKIKNGENYRKLRPEDIVSFFSRAVHYLREELSKEFDGQTVVVTHFSPSPSLVHPRYAGQETNHYFNANCDDLITEFAPNYWLYGHTHDAMHTKLGETYVLSNPRGYYRYEDEDRTGFDHDFWMEI